MSESNFTDAELAEIRQESKAGTAKALAGYVKGALVGFLLLLFGVGYGLHNNTNVAKAGRTGLAQQQRAIVLSGQAVSVEGCNRDFRTGQQQIKFYSRARFTNLRNYKQSKLTYKQYRVGDKFYSDAIADVILPDCRKVKDILTLDTPNKPVRVQTPLYPGSPLADKG